MTLLPLLVLLNIVAILLGLVVAIVYDTLIFPEPYERDDQ